jgi:hypothetical protein
MSQKGEDCLVDEEPIAGSDYTIQQDEEGAYSEKKPYETRGSKTRIGVPEDILASTKNVQDIINHYFLKVIEDKVRENFKQAFHFADQENSSELNSAIREAHSAVFHDGPKNPGDRIKRYLALFPDIEAQLLMEQPELKPLFCQYEVWKHRRDRWRKTGKILGRISSIAGYSGIIASAILALPALPVAVMSVGAIKVVSGGIGLSANIASMSDHSAGKAAKEVLSFQKTLKKHIEKLGKEKASLPAPERATIEVRMKNLEKAVNTIESHRSELEDAVKKRKAVRQGIVSNLLNIGLGSVMIHGGLQLQEKFKDFRSSTVEQQNPFPDQPSTDFGNGAISPDP